MTDEAQHRPNLSRYLLGQVSPQEREQIEGLYFRDDELFEELVSAENDLIDRYIRGDLGETEKEHFEAHFLSTPERVQRVEFARSLASAAFAGNMPASTRTNLRPAISRLFVRLAAAALLASLIGLAWMVVANRRLHHQLEEAQQGQIKAQEETEELRRKITDLQQPAGASGQTGNLPAPGSAILSLVLAPDLVRSNAQQVTVQLSPMISRVVLLLRCSNDNFSPYEAVLETVEGSQVWQKKNLISMPEGNEGTVVSVDIPANVLKRGDYVARLLGAAIGQKPTELGVYSFRVTHVTEK